MRHLLDERVQFVARAFAPHEAFADEQSAVAVAAQEAGRLGIVDTAFGHHQWVRVRACRGLRQGFSQVDGMRGIGVEGTQAAVVHPYEVGAAVLVVQFVGCMQFEQDLQSEFVGLLRKFTALASVEAGGDKQHGVSPAARACNNW